MRPKNPAPQVAVCNFSRAPKILELEAISVPERKQKVGSEEIKALAQSMSEIGLQTPITVRYPKPDMGEASDCTLPTLVAGAHRLEAAKSLGWTTIECFVMDDEGVAAELWEIAENLHRRHLSKRQRDAHIRRYADLLLARGLQSGQTVPFESQREDGKGHRSKGIASQIAEETGLSAKTVTRALKATEAEDAVQTQESPKPKIEAARSRLMKAWFKASEEDRRWFLNWADGEALPQDIMSPAMPGEEADPQEANTPSQGDVQ